MGITDNIFFEDEFRHCVKTFAANFGKTQWQETELHKKLLKLAEEGHKEIIVMPRPKFKIPRIMPIEPNFPKEEFDAYRTRLMGQMFAAAAVPLGGHIITNIVLDECPPNFMKNHKNTMNLKQFIKHLRRKK